VFKNLEETMHVQVGHLSQVSTFDLFEFLSKIFFQNLNLRVRLICKCGLYAGVYGNKNIVFTCVQVDLLQPKKSPLTYTRVIHKDLTK